MTARTLLSLPIEIRQKILSHLISKRQLKYAIVSKSHIAPEKVVHNVCKILTLTHPILQADVLYLSKLWFADFLVELLPIYHLHSGHVNAAPILGQWVIQQNPLSLKEFDQVHPFRNLIAYEITEYAEFATRKISDRSAIGAACSFFYAGSEFVFARMTLLMKRLKSTR